MEPFLHNVTVETEQIDLNIFGIEDRYLFIRREDLIHPFISGNKFRKLKYNIQAAKQQGHHSLLTFGGAFSNHIAAVAATGKEFGFKTIGIIRGEELAYRVQENPTLSFAQNSGMQLHFVSREAYKKKDNKVFINDLIKKFNDFYLLPEGGTNALAVKGCEEMLKKNKDSVFNYICVPVGTGGTLAGLVKASDENQTVVGFSALKGTFQSSEIANHTHKTNFGITDTYCFGGYGKIDVHLVRFINSFKQKTGIPLDPVYTGKMMYGVVDLIKKGYFKENSRILAIHTGGLQGVAGMNKLLERKKLPLIE